MKGIAWGVLATAVAVAPLYLYMLNRILGIGAGLFLRATARPVLAALVMAAVVRASMPTYNVAAPIQQAIVWLVLGIAIGVLVYCAAIYLLWLLAGRPEGAEKLLIGRLLARFRREMVQ